MATKPTGRGRDWRKGQVRTAQAHRHLGFRCTTSWWCKAITHVLSDLRLQHPHRFSKIRARVTGFAPRPDDQTTRWRVSAPLPFSSRSYRPSRRLPTP